MNSVCRKRNIAPLPHLLHPPFVGHKGGGGGGGGGRGLCKGCKHLQKAGIDACWKVGLITRCSCHLYSCDPRFFFTWSSIYSHTSVLPRSNRRTCQPELLLIIIIIIIIIIMTLNLIDLIYSSVYYVGFKNNIFFVKKKQQIAKQIATLYMQRNCLVKYRAKRD